MFGSMLARTTTSFGLWHAKFRQHAEGELGMEERHQLATGAVKGFVMNQFNTRSGGLLKLGFDIVRAKGKVMNAASGILFQELGNRTFRVGWFEQFDVDFAHAEESGAHLLRGYFLAVFALQAKRFFVIGDSLVERPHGDSNVIDFFDHKFKWTVIVRCDPRAAPAGFARRARL